MNLAFIAQAWELDSLRFRNPPLMQRGHSYGAAFFTEPATPSPERTLDGRRAMKLVAKLAELGKCPHWRRLFNLLACIFSFAIVLTLIWNHAILLGYGYAIRCAAYAWTTPSDSYEKGLSTYSDWIDSSELKRLYFASERMISTCSGKKPEVYMVTDRIDYPSLDAVWQLSDHYILLRAAQGNDSDALHWFVANGKFKPERDGCAYKHIEGNSYPLPLRQH